MGSWGHCHALETVLCNAGGTQAVSREDSIKCITRLTAGKKMKHSKLSEMCEEVITDPTKV